VDLPLKEHRLDIFESEAIPDLHEMAENILNFAKFPIPYFSIGHSKNQKSHGLMSGDTVDEKSVPDLSY
jgi:hypothetical protein